MQLNESILSPLQVYFQSHQSIRARQILQMAFSETRLPNVDDPTQFWQDFVRLLQIVVAPSQSIATNITHPRT